MKNIILLLFLSCGLLNSEDNKTMRMNKITDNTIDYVPNEETAIKIAEAIWLPIFGERILDNKPFRVSLREEVWIVKGTLPKGFKGGTPYIEIQKKDCKIIKVTHSK